MASVAQLAQLVERRVFCKRCLLLFFYPSFSLVAVAQLVESQIVILAVVGSSPIRHPIIPIGNKRVSLLPRGDSIFPPLFFLQSDRLLVSARA